MPCKPETRNGNEIFNYTGHFQSHLLALAAGWVAPMRRCWGAVWPGPGQEPLPSKSPCSRTQLGLQGTDAGKVSELSGSALPLLRKSWTGLALAQGWGSRSGAERWELRGLSEAPAPTPSWHIQSAAHSDSSSVLSSPVPQVGFPRRCCDAAPDARCLYGINAFCGPETAGLDRRKSRFGMNVQHRLG